MDDGEGTALIPGIVLFQSRPFGFSSRISEIGEPRTSREGILLDLFNACGQSNSDEICAILKGVLTYDLYALGNVELGQGGTAVKGIHTEIFNAVEEGYGFQLRAIGKHTSGKIGDALGDDDAFYRASRESFFAQIFRHKAPSNKLVLRH